MAVVTSDLAKKSGGVSLDDFRRDNIAGSHGTKNHVPVVVWDLLEKYPSGFYSLVQDT